MSLKWRSRHYDIITYSGRVLVTVWEAEMEFQASLWGSNRPLLKVNAYGIIQPQPNAPKPIPIAPSKRPTNASLCRPKTFQNRCFFAAGPPKALGPLFLFLSSSSFIIRSASLIFFGCSMKAGFLLPPRAFFFAAAKTFFGLL
jgi:hypothetical protein